MDRGSEGERAVGRHGVDAEIARETVDLEHSPARSSGGASATVDR
jgi:hypothetical protein